MQQVAVRTTGRLQTTKQTFSNITKKGETFHNKLRFPKGKRCLNQTKIWIYAQRKFTSWELHKIIPSCIRTNTSCSLSIRTFPHASICIESQLVVTKTDYPECSICLRDRSHNQVTVSKCSPFRVLSPRMWQRTDHLSVFKVPPSLAGHLQCIFDVDFPPMTTATRWDYYRCRVVNCLRFQERALCPRRTAKLPFLIFEFESFECIPSPTRIAHPSRRNTARYLSKQLLENAND